jgi:hypothetical protein
MRELNYGRVVSVNSDYEYIGHYEKEENTYTNAPDYSEQFDKIVEKLKALNIYKFTAIININNTSQPTTLTANEDK